MERQKLIVISADAMVEEDLEEFQKLPNYKRWLEGGSRIRKVRSIYPTVTYACHTTMATGNLPWRHGVVSNSDWNNIGQARIPWNFFHKAVKTEDIFDAAKKAGLSTAGLSWPVCGCHPGIDYLVAEYWRQWPEDTTVDAYKRSGSSDEVMEIIEKNLHALVEKTHPMCDEFHILCACDMIHRWKPDLIMIHLANLDDYRHENGVFHKRVTQGIHEMDRWLGMIMDTVEREGLVPVTNLVITSDHGQLDIKRCINLNVLLGRRGFLLAGDQGEPKEWDAYCLSNGLSALVFLKRPDDPLLVGRVYRYLEELRGEGVYGIEEILTVKEAKERYGLEGDFSFVLESDGYTSFGASCQGPLVIQPDVRDYRYGRATHGHQPEKGPQPTFLAKGPGIREGVVLENGRLEDQAPTYGKLLGIPFPDCDGTPIYQILRQ